MTEFYDSNPWLSFGQGHPGGIASTQALLRHGNFSVGERLLDLCCGSGVDTALAATLGLEAIGVDRAPCVLRAAAAHKACRFFSWEGGPLPFPDQHFQGILCQCSLSQLDEKSAVVHELSRVLQPCGVLLLSDLYEIEPPQFPEFLLEFWEDQTPQLLAFSAQWLWETGSRFPCNCKGGGYFAGCYRLREAIHDGF